VANFAAGWAALTLINGYTPYSGANPQYRIDGAGNVYLRGILASGNQNTVAFQLPAGARPGSKQDFASSGAVTANGSGWNIVLGFVQIDTNGNATIFQSTSSGTVVSVPLDGIVFLAEN
jgi:hypothetical protein